LAGIINETLGKPEKNKHKAFCVLLSQIYSSHRFLRFNTLTQRVCNSWLRITSAGDMRFCIANLRIDKGLLFVVPPNRCLKSF